MVANFFSVPQNPVELLENLVELLENPVELPQNSVKLLENMLGILIPLCICKLCQFEILTNIATSLLVKIVTNY